MSYITYAVLLNYQSLPEIQPLVLQQHQQVIHQVRRLILQLEAVVHGGGQRGLHAFFPTFCAIRLVPLAYSFAV